MQCPYEGYSMYPITHNDKTYYVCDRHDIKVMVDEEGREMELCS